MLSELIARAMLEHLFLASTYESREVRSGTATFWSWELELESEDLSESASERRDRRSSTAVMKSW